MPSLLAAVKAAGTQRAQQRSAALAVGGQKSIVQSGPLLQPSLIGRPLQQRDWPPDVAVDRYFKASALVYRGVVASATAIGSVRWQAEVRDGDRWVLDETHPLQVLLDQPHAFFSRQAWNELMVMYLAIAGNTLCQKTTASGKLASGATKPRLLELIPLVPSGINPVPDPVEWISHYVYRGPPRKVWKAEEILHILLPDPGNPYWGVSPLQAARRVIAMDLAAVDWNLSSMKNRAISDGVFSVKQALTQPQYDELKDQIWEQHQGGGNSHEPWVLGGDTQWVEMSRTPVEMDFNETRNRTREEILSSLGLPPVMAGYFENATLANAEVSRRLFWEDSAIPMYVERIAGAFNASVVPHFGAPGKLRVSYDISGIPALRDDLIKKGQGLRMLVNCGVPYNQAIEEMELDLPPVPELGDLPYGVESLRQSFNRGGGGAPALQTDIGVVDGSVDPAELEPPATPDGAGPQVSPVAQVPPDAAGPVAVTSHTRTKPSGAASLAAGRARKFDVTTRAFATTVADEEAPAIERAFLAVIAALKDDATLQAVLEAVKAGDIGAALQRLGAYKLPGLLSSRVGGVIERTAARGADLAGGQLAGDIGRDFTVSSSRLASWAKPYVSERTAQLVSATEDAVRGFFADLAAGKLGDSAETAAQLLIDTFGLHGQQAVGVRNAYAMLIGQGKAPEAALITAAKLARARLADRALTIAAHESMTAANRGYGLAWDQALDEGVVAKAFATWFAEEDDRTDDVCVSLDGQEINLGAGERFVDLTGAHWLEPPAHVGCRCGRIISAVT